VKPSDNFTNKAVGRRDFRKDVDLNKKILLAQVLLPVSLRIALFGGSGRKMKLRRKT
jgi:hypothetical protein